MFGVFPHVVRTDTPLVRGFDDLFWAPHSRYGGIRREDILRVPDLDIVTESPLAGLYMVATRDGPAHLCDGSL